MVQNCVSEPIWPAADERQLSPAMADDLIEDGQRPLVDGDQIVLANVEVQLGGYEHLITDAEIDSLHDDKQVVAVIVDLGWVHSRVQAVFDGQLMEMEEVPEHGCVG